MIEPIDIVITAYKRPKMLMETIKYLKERTKYPYRLFMVHNGGCEEAILEYEKDFFLIIDPNYNVGIHCAWNLALAVVSSKYFITMDSDILVPDLESDWLTQLVGLMDARPDYGAIALQPHKFIGLEPTRHPMDEKGEIIFTPMTGAVARLMRRDAVWKSGGWERIVRQSRNHEESTICSRLSTAGYKFGYTAKMKAFHMWGDGITEDDWGYPLEMGVETHGHNPVWPQPRIYSKKEDYDNKTWEPKT